MGSPLGGLQARKGLFSAAPGTGWTPGPLQGQRSWTSPSLNATEADSQLEKSNIHEFKAQDLSTKTLKMLADGYLLW